MITTEKIKDIIANRLKESNDFIVNISIKPGNKIYVEIDNFKGVTIDQCVAYSRDIEKNLDRDVEDFELQVSSPGIDKPFKVFQQYEKNIGKLVSVTINDGTRYEGELKQVKESGISIEVSLKKNKKEIEKHIQEFSFSIIKTVKLIIKF